MLVPCKRAGNQRASQAVSEFLLKSYVQSSPESPQRDLTVREREILKLVAEGKTNREIGRLTNTSPKTVETHRARIMKKLKAQSAADLIRYAIKHRLIEP